jgi:DNA-binding MarR family transcriptional regulator
MQEVDVGTADRYPEVTPAMKHVLLFVERDGSRVTELAELAGMTKQSMSEHVDGLVALGLLERTRDPADGRAKLIRPTRAGLACMRHALDVAMSVHRHWEAILGADRTNQLMQILKELEAGLAAERASGG